MILTVLFISLLLSFGSAMAAVAAENTPSKEVVIDSMIRRIQARNDLLGKFQVSMVAVSKTEAKRQFDIILAMRYTFDGLKKTGAQFMNASINGIPISESQLDQLKERFSSQRDLGLDLFREDINSFDPAKLYDQCWLDGSDFINGIAVFKLKYIPVESKRINEAELYLDQTTFDLIKTDITVKASERIQSGRIVIAYQQRLKEYSLPSLITCQVQMITELNGQSVVVKTNLEIKLTDYQSL
jgi:hypothetical protein